MVEVVEGSLMYYNYKELQEPRTENDSDDFIDRLQQVAWHVTGIFDSE